MGICFDPNVNEVERNCIIIFDFVCVCVYIYIYILFFYSHVDVQEKNTHQGLKACGGRHFG
jgi:hypothetical protein